MQLECINEAAYQLENELMDAMGKVNPFTETFTEINDRLWAALYILQKEDSGVIPENFALIMAKADMWDAGIDGEAH